MTARRNSLTDGCTFADLPPPLVSSGWEEISRAEGGTVAEQQDGEELRRIVGRTEFHGVRQRIREFGRFAGVRFLSLLLACLLPRATRRGAGGKGLTECQRWLGGLERAVWSDSRSAGVMVPDLAAGTTSYARWSAN